MRVGEHAGLQQREVRVVAAVQRQLIDRFRPDQITELGARDVDERRAARDRHLLAQATDLQREVDHQRLGDRQLHVAADVRLEPGQLGAQLLGARRQPSDDVSAFRVRATVRDSAVSAFRGDRDPGQRARSGSSTVPAIVVEVWAAAAGEQRDEARRARTKAEWTGRISAELHGAGKSALDRRFASDRRLVSSGLPGDGLCDKDAWPRRPVRALEASCACVGPRLSVDRRPRRYTQPVSSMSGSDGPRHRRVYVLHQDVWFWRHARPLVFGFLPVGLFYHGGYCVAVALLMWLLMRLAWPSHLEDRRGRVDSGGHRLRISRHHPLHRHLRVAHRAARRRGEEYFLAGRSLGRPSSWPRCSAPT